MKISPLLDKYFSWQIFPWLKVGKNRSIVSGYHDVLFRNPTRREIKHWRRAGIDFSSFRARMQDGPEYRKIVLPIRNEVRSAYRMFHFREPREQEIADHLNTLRKSFKNDDDLLASIRSGEVRRLLDIRPINLEMDITNQCNLRCVMCPFSQPSVYKRKTKHMPVEVFQKLADSVFHAVNYLSLAYGTESLLHPEFDRFISIASRYGIRRIYINTNGLLLTEKHVERMVESGLKDLSISIDAATSETYSKIRKGGDFNRVIRNIRMVNRIRDKAGAEYPKVGMLFVLMQQNIHELPAFVNLAHDLGAVGVNAMHLIPFKMLDNQEQTAIVDKKKCNEMLAEARGRAQAAGMAFTAPKEFDLNDHPCDEGPTAIDERQETINAPIEDAPSKESESDIRQRFGLNLDANWHDRSPCPFPWHFMAIEPQGNVAPCGWWYGQPVMGNIYEQDLLEIWHNERYTALRKELTTRQPREACRICPAAGLGDPNQGCSFSIRG